MYFHISVFAAFTTDSASEAGGVLSQPDRVRDMHVTDGFATSGWSLPTTRKLAKLMDTHRLFVVTCVCDCYTAIVWGSNERRTSIFEARAAVSPLVASGQADGIQYTTIVSQSRAVCSLPYTPLSLLSLSL